MWFSPRAIGLHITVLIVVPTFFALFDWQLHRALGGNGLSWAYVFEWPFFAVYAVYLWWKLVHEPPGEPLPARPVPGTGAGAGTGTVSENDSNVGGGALSGQGGIAPAPTTPEDAELAAYNKYLADLDAHDRRSDR